LFVDPRYLGNDKKTYSIVIDMMRSSNSDSTKRRIYTQMEVLDILSDNLYLEIAHFYFVHTKNDKVKLVV
jgi:hypothetical protein